MHGIRAASLVVAWLLALGCARKPDAPVARGEVCRSQDDCNRKADGGVQRCGVLRLCVAGRCEAARDAGTPGSRVLVCSADAGSDARNED